ncbi:MAG: hypothetical protein QRY16_19830 [Enterobacterales bacterium endosymbiont of Blomia tropicalis]|uniref:hypothetical protein n=1 Tax=Mixta mediterraneensis TaxID=2758443 RepID=UPI0018739ECE|nr:hypothetical protein [Mixta mediterraneensis]MBE5254341.1 hypothetical protein [Mixta mediterraneensis]MDL4915934.1 hypothetical protein [Mixta mediterraneensis]
MSGIGVIRGSALSQAAKAMALDVTRDCNSHFKSAAHARSGKRLSFAAPGMYGALSNVSWAQFRH